MSGLAALLPQDHVLFLRQTDQAAVMNELARKAAALLGLKPAPIAAALMAREALGSTGVGAGIALPHARLAGLPAPLALFARLDTAVAWHSIDGGKVDLLFLLLSPEDGTAHLQALALATRRLRDRVLAAAIRAAASPDSVRALLVEPPTAPRCGPHAADPVRST